MILVVGATGLVGFEVCNRLRQEGCAIRGLVRPGSPGDARLRQIGVECVHGDLKDTPSIKRACAGIETIISTATCTTRRRKGDTLQSVDRDGQFRLIAAARDADVRRFVYVSLSPNASRRSELVVYKREVERHLQASGLEWVILQPSAFMDIWLSRRLGWDFPRRRARIVGAGHYALSLISVADVAAFCVRAALDRTRGNRALPIGGPEALTPLEIVQLAERLSGKRYRVQHVPTVVIGAAAVLLRPIAPIPAALLALAAGTARHGDRIEMSATAKDWSIRLTSVRDYLGAQLGS
jgi:uncharacterized protein YbjT (DUF2867 family)